MNQNQTAPSPLASSLRSRGHSVARPILASALLLATAGATASAAAVWNSSMWALHASVGAGVTYESNLYNRKNGEGDTILETSPTLRLARIASATNLEVVGTVRARKYLDISAEDSIDPSLSISYAYPDTEESLPTREATLHWSRSNEPDADVGQRIELTVLDGRFEGTLYDTGKTTIDGNIGAGTQDYSRYDSQATSGNVGLAVGYRPRGLVKYSLGYDYASSSYETSGVALSKVTRRSHDLSARVRGELTPKISGRISLGINRADYGGTLDFSRTDWTMGAQLEWAQTERRRFSVDASRNSYFTADGQAAVTTSLNGGMYQELPSGLTLNIRARAAAISYENGSSSSYDVVGTGLSLLYNRTGRLGGEVGANVNQYSSNQGSRDFSSYSLFARVAYQF